MNPPPPRNLIASLALATSGIAAAQTEPLVLDMVHHIPGEARYVSKYEDPQVIKDIGYNGKVYFLFDSPMLAVNWETVDADIFPKGSPGREWVDAKAAQIDAAHAACQAAGVKVYAMSDLILFPKALIEKHQMKETFGDPRHPDTQKFLRLLIAQMFDRFPKLDGIVVRIGETYLHDAPFHVGNIKNKTSAEDTIIPLMNILREEVCVKRNKQVVFRSRPLLPGDSPKLWTEDKFIDTTAGSNDATVRQRILEQNDESLRQWAEIVQLAREIRFRDAATSNAVITSALYGLRLYRIYHVVIRLSAEGMKGDPKRLQSLLAEYDQAWADYRCLPDEHPSCATLYKESGSPWGPKPGINAFVGNIRAASSVK